MTQAQEGKRKRRLAIMAGFGMLALIGFVAWQYFGVHVGPHRQTRDTPPPSRASLEREARDKRAKEIVEQAKKAKTEDERLRILAQVPRMLRGYVAAKASVGDVNLHGRVVDENDRPVVGATVYYNTGGGFLGGATGAGNTTTDADGRFETGGRGSSLTIQSIRKDGFRVPVKTQPPYFFEVNFDDWMDFSHERPKVFRAWKIPKDMIEPYEIVKSEFAVGFRQAGEYNEVDLFRGMAKLRAPSGFVLKGARVRFELLSFERDEEEPKRSAWKVRLTVVNGGGFAPIPSEELFMTEAPVAGYEQSIELASKPSTHLNEFRQRSFWYIYLENHKKYGRVTVLVSAPDHRKDETMGISISASFNLSGQRYMNPYSDD